MNGDDRALLQRVAAYQFGADAGPALFPEDDSLEVKHTSSGRPRQIIARDGRIATYRRVGRLTLGIAGARRLAAAFEPPRHRVVVGDESEPFLREGRNAFAKFVQTVDEGIRPGDETLLVHEDGRLIAIGRAELSGEGMLDFETGVAVSVREGQDADEESA